MADFHKNGDPVNFPRLTAYVLGAGFIVWLGGGGATPLLVGAMGLVLVRKILRDVF